VAILAVLIFCALLAGCAYGFWKSCQLMFRGFRGLTGQNRRPVVQPKTRESVTRPGVSPDIPPWAQATISDHIATCETCRTSYVEGTLPLLQPETVTRIVALVEAHDAPRVKPL